MRDENFRVKKIFLFLFFLIFSFQPSAVADDTDLKLSGYIKNFFILSEGDDDTTLEGLSRLRLRLDIMPSESTSFELAYELIPRLREDDVRFFRQLLPTRAVLSYRAFDLDEMIYPDDRDSTGDFVLFQNLDRAYLTVSTDSLDISVGRQPVSFGSAHVISPTDIIAPFTYNTIAKEELVGVDAVRLKTPLAEMGELDLGLIFGEDFEPDKSAAFVRLKTYQHQTDIAFMAMVFRENILLGVDIARSVGGAGTWFEAAQTLANITSRYTSGENYFRLSIGADYSVTSELYAYIEYHYSGAGSGSPEDYFKHITETAFTDGAVYLLGRHYLSPGFSYEITPILFFHGQALINVEDGSALVSPGFEYSVAQDVFLELRAYVGVGEGSSHPLLPDSEFGLYPDVYYGALNFYF
jgi:hypothetical protein